MTKLWKLAVLAFVAMCIQDVLTTAMVIFQARYNAIAAGLFDVAGWLTGLFCAALAIESIIQNGWRNRRSIVLIASVSLANFVGTVLGVAITAAITHHH